MNEDERSAALTQLHQLGQAWIRWLVVHRASRRTPALDPFTVERIDRVERLCQSAVVFGSPALLQRALAEVDALHEDLYGHDD
jgi:hypothetical protein